MESNDNISVNREYKDNLFRALFGENKRNVLSLYNALNGTDYTNEEELQYTTLQDVIYIKHKNDVSIMIDSSLSLYEHQSTYSENLPLRGLLYFADLYRQLIEHSEDLYGTRRVKMPTPKFVVFYNGKVRKLEDEVVKLKLSDLFEKPAAKGEFEWTATLLDINEGRNEELKNSCEKLREYCILVDEHRRNLEKGKSKEEAIDIAVRYCMENGVLVDFLTKHLREVKDMVLTEFNEERYKQVVYRDGYLDGVDDGISKGRLNTLYEIYDDELLSVQDSVKKSGLSEEEFISGFNEWKKNKTLIG